MNPSRSFFGILVLVGLTTSARADIYRWDTGALIPGTEGVTPGPGVTLGRWNRDDRNLRFADFSGGLQLSSAVFQDSWLDNADFSRARLDSAHLLIATLTSSKFVDADLSHADLQQTKLTNADFTGAIVTGTSFGATGLTKEQLYSTASYKQNTLQGIKLWNNDLSAWNFSGQDLSASDLSGSALTGAIFDDAIIAGAGFAGTGFTQQQMHSVRQRIDALLLRGAFSGNLRLVGMCNELYDHRDWLWTFFDVEGAQPTNNASERALRHAVIWRKLSFGTQSAAGSRFVETILTVLETCRQQARNAFAFLTHTLEARLAVTKAPSLLPSV